MRDEYDARLWVDHHEGLARLIDRGFALLRSAAGRLASWDGSSHHLLALLLAFAITGLSFNTTAT